MRAVSCLCLLLLAGGPSAADDEKNIRGEWWCSSLVIDGQKVKLSVASKIRLTLNGKEYRERALNDDLAIYRYTLLPGGLIRFDVPGGEGVGFLGRYELIGDKLRLCFPGPIDDEKGALPPAAFTSAKGSKVTLATWERVRD